MGFVITGCANLMILGEIPSYPVAFLMFNLFICLVTKSSFIGLKNNLSLFVLFVSILFILGWVLSIWCSYLLYLWLHSQAHGAWISFPPTFFQNFHINHSFFKIFIIIRFSSFDNISRRHTSWIIRLFCVHSFSTDTV